MVKNRLIPTHKIEKGTSHSAGEIILSSKVRSKNITTTFQVGGEIKGLSKLTSDVREELLVEIK